MKTNTIKSIALAASLLGGTFTAHAQLNTNGITNVIYILMENRNFTENESAGGQQILGSTNAPFINSLLTPGNPHAAQVSYASCYHNALATTNGSNPSIHPSEPQYVWMECGNNMSKSDDNDPYTANSVKQIFDYAATNPAVTTESLSGMIQSAGLTWKSYSEGVNLQNTSGSNYNTAGGTLTAIPVLSNAWTVPLASFSGTSASYTNPYNGTHQYNFACKHTGQLFFPISNGSTVNTANTSTSNVEASHYPPLCQFTNDLANNTLANYNVITPDQFNDMHTALSGSWTSPQNGQVTTGDSSQVAQGDNFLSIIVPQITNSATYQAGHTAIVIWTDETEGSNQNDFNHTLLEIVISPLAKGNAYNSQLNYTHSSDVATMQKIFGVTAGTASGFLNDAANASFSSGGNVGVSQISGAHAWSTAFTQAASPTGGFGTNTAQDLSDLFTSAVIPSALPGLPVKASGLSYNRKTGVYSQSVTVTNVTSGTIGNPVYLVLGNLGSNYMLTNSLGTTVNNNPGSPYVLVANTLAAGASATVSLQYTSTGGALSSIMSAITTDAQP